MRNIRTLAVLVLVVALLGALAASAGASPVLKHKAGATIKVGTTVYNSFGEFAFTTTLGNVVCLVGFLGEVKENTGTKVAIQTGGIFGINSGTDLCATNIIGPDKNPMLATIRDEGSTPWCLETTAARAPEAWINGGACGGKTHLPVIVWDLYEWTPPHKLVASCVYEAQAEMKGTYTTKFWPLEITVPSWSFTLKAGGGACPAKGTGSGSLQITSGDGKAESTMFE